jgi:hypothetical protein
LTDKNPTVGQTNMECSNNHSNDLIDKRLEGNATGHKDANHSTKILTNTTRNKDGTRNSASPKFTEKIISEKSEQTSSNLNGQHDDSDVQIDSHDTRNRNQPEFESTSKTSDDKLRERMLNIESELRSLRSELEDRNKICRGTPLSSRQDQSKELNETQADSSERGQSSSKRRRSGNNETEMNSPVESNLLRNDVCDSAVLNKMVNIY